MTYPEFNPRTASADEIMQWARPLEGQPIGRMTASKWADRVCDASAKGAVGGLYEKYFGIVANSEQEPDFPGAGIELKSVPILMNPGPNRVKERTMLSMIDYMKVVDEQWANASVRKKLDHIFFIFYGYERGATIGSLRTLKVHLWSPTAEIMPFLEDDWLVVRGKVEGGLAHTISEADGRILGAATKSADSSKRRRQPRSVISAKPRAWALKPAFTWTIYLEAVGKFGGVSVIQQLKLQRRPLLFEQRILDKLTPLVGRALGEIEGELRINHSEAKNAVASALRRMLALPPRGTITEFERFGIEVKMAPLRPDAMPYEAMSFPAFEHLALQDEDWEDSDLLRRLQRVLFLPVLRRTRGAPVKERWLGRPFFWTPGPGDLVGIREEWEHIRQMIRDRRAKELPHESETRFIHVRPKGRDANDRDMIPGGGTVTKKCLWLNKRYVQRIVLESGTDWSGTMEKR